MTNSDVPPRTLHPPGSLAHIVHLFCTGGSVFVAQGAASPVFVNSIFRNNTAASGCPLSCTVEKRSDNVCDSSECLSRQCGWDYRGTCCPAECDALWSNGVCNPACNVEACGWDGGDCCDSSACTNLAGNGACDSACNNKYCGFDRGDCSTDVTSSWGGYDLAEHVGFDGHAKGGVGALLGGASATISGSHFEHNKADLGGAFYVQGCTTRRASDAPCPYVDLGETSSILVTDSTIVGADAERGGFIYSAIGATVDVERVRASAGRASQQGGLLWASQSTITIKDTNATRHAAEDGAFAYVSDCAFNMDRSEVLEGQSSRAGGALVFTDGSRGTIGNTTLSNNAALLGGAIRVVSSLTAAVGPGRLDTYSIAAGPSLLLESSTIESNVATSEGGAILLEGSATRVSSIELRASSFDLNRCDSCNGGTVYANGGDVLARDTAFLHSTAVEGGAVYARASTVQLQGAQVRSSTASLPGGGLSLFQSTLNISASSVLEGNRATDRGGALDLTETATGIDDSDLSSNEASTGGAVAALTSAIEVRNSGITQNTALGDGGAFKMNEGSLLLEAVDGRTNNASNDGGFLHATEVVNIWRGSSLLSNTARYGGANYLDRSSMLADTVTMSDNHAVRGGAAYISGRHTTEEFTVSNAVCRANSVRARADVIDSLNVPIDAQVCVTTRSRA